MYCSKTAFETKLGPSVPIRRSFQIIYQMDLSIIVLNLVLVIELNCYLINFLVLEMKFRLIKFNF